MNFLLKMAVAIMVPVAVFCTGCIHRQHLTVHATEVPADAVASCCTTDGESKCVGSAYCNACTNCSRCGHCSSGGSCGVCAGGSNRSTNTYSPPSQSRTVVSPSNTNSTPASGSGAHAGLAQISFWTDMDLRGEIQIFVDDVYRGVLDNSFPSGAPRCGQEGTLTIALAPGVYAFRARYAGGQEWKGELTISDSDCKTMKLSR